MNLFYLRYFVTLAKVRQYTKAAERLCIAQPSLSHAIAQLEKELGLPLFEKSGRKTTLTRFGEEFLVCAERTLATLDAGVESLQRGARGDGLIRLGFLRPLGVEFIPKLAAEFLRDARDSNIQFVFAPESAKACWRDCPRGNSIWCFVPNRRKSGGFRSFPSKSRSWF